MSDDFMKNIDAGLEEFDSQKSEEILSTLSNLPEVIDKDNLSVDILDSSEENQAYRYALESLVNNAKITDKAIRDVYMLALSSDSPRAYEVLSSMLKTQIDASKAITDTIKNTTKNNGGDENIPSTVNNVQNNYYQTVDVIDMIKDAS